MKNYFLPILILAATVFSTTSCKKDNDAPEVKSVLTLGTKEFKLTNAYSSAEDEGDGTFSHLLFLTSDGITATQDGDLSGVGDLLAMPFVSTNATSITDGKYTYSQNGGAMTFSGGFFKANYDIQNDVIGDLEEMTITSVDVKNDGSKISITFDHTGLAGGSGKCSFKGKFILLE